MADLKPFEVIMRLYPIAGQNGKGEVCMKAERVSELIRCKDCLFWRRYTISCEGYARCETGEGGIRLRREYDFCSRGERRSEDDTI